MESSEIANRRRDRWVLALGVLLALGFLAWLGSFHALFDWLFFRYAAYFAVSFGCVGCAALGGDFILTSLLRLELPRSERLIQATALGITGFTGGWFLLGLLRAWTAPVAVIWPLVFAAPGAVAVWRARHRWLRFARAHSRIRLSLPAAGGLALGVLGLVLVYLPLIHPENLSFDARFYHQALAEHYVAERGVTPFREGWVPGACPQLASYLYGWAYSLPWTSLFDRVELSTHLELVLFLCTLASVPTLVERLLPGRRAPLAWLAVLAFPGLYCYDSTLSGAADHIAALFAVPLLLASFRALPALEPRACALVGALAAAVLSTKYTAYGLLLGPLGALGARAGWLLLRGEAGRRGALLRGPLLALGLLLLLSAPHWLKNWLWYGDPLYPFLHAQLALEPWGPHAAERLDWLIDPHLQAERSVFGVLDSLFAAFSFAFISHDWWHMHHDWPVFGALYSLSLPLALLTRPSRRFWLLCGAVFVGVAQWFWSFQFDRYLQVFVPWMAAAVAVVAMQLWRIGPGARGVAVLLGAAQLVWGSDVPFFPNHQLVGTSPLHVSIRFLSSGFRQPRERFRVYGDWGEVGRALPVGARVLLHDQLLRLGFGVSVISDGPMQQYGIDYALGPTPREVDARLRQLGITHLVWEADKSQAWDTLAGDLAFLRFAREHTEGRRRFGRFELARMPSRPPDLLQRHERVLVLSCGKTYADGLYELKAMSVQQLRVPRPTSDFPRPSRVLADTPLDELAAAADVLVHDPSCHPEPVPAGFKPAFPRKEENVYFRER